MSSSVSGNNINTLSESVQPIALAKGEKAAALEKFATPLFHKILQGPTAMRIAAITITTIGVLALFGSPIAGGILLAGGLAILTASAVKSHIEAKKMIQETVELASVASPLNRGDSDTGV